MKRRWVGVVGAALFHLACGIEPEVGSDAGPLDAGPLDAGPFDAGPFDAGPLDAGPLDAGPLDAGPLDAGPLDAGFDSGVPCSTRTGPSVVFINAGDDVGMKFSGRMAGTTYIFDAGVHRLSAPIQARAGDRFFGTVSADCRNLSSIRGSVRLDSSGFTPVGIEWKSVMTFGVDSFGGQTTDVCGSETAGNPTCEGGRHCLLYNELHHVRVDGGTRRLEPVVDAGAPLDGATFRFVRLPSGQASVEVTQVPTAGESYELSQVSYAFSSAANDVTVADLVIEFFSNPHQTGAVGGSNPGDRWRVDDVEARHNHGGGIRVSHGGRIGSTYVHHNGQIGVRVVDGADAGVLDNEVAHNNTAGYCRRWEAGGSKFARTQGLMVKRNCVHDNNGTGLWTDIRNYATRYEANVVFDNYYGGIFHEVSGDAGIYDNVVARNGVGQLTRGPLRGAQILISLSPGVEVAGNKVLTGADFGQGIMFTWDDRSMPCCPPDVGTCAVTCTLAGERAYNNDVVVSNAWGRSGLFFASSVDAGMVQRQLAFGTSAFFGNRYFVSDAGNATFGWGNAGAVDDTLTFAQFRSVYGQEDGGFLRGHGAASRPDIESMLVCPPRSRR